MYNLIHVSNDPRPLPSDLGETGALEFFDRANGLCLGASAKIRFRRETPSMRKRNLAPGAWNDRSEQFAWSIVTRAGSEIQTHGGAVSDFLFSKLGNLLRF
jgi:hypothetical protein